MVFFTSFEKRAKELVRGGKADGHKDSEYPEDQLKKGRKVEMEHTGNPALAREIARDHLEEDKEKGIKPPNYYDRLEKVEKKAFDLGFSKAARELTTKSRNKLSGSSFVFPRERRYPIHDLCLSGHTEIQLLDGRSVPIKDLVGQSIWVYSYNISRNCIVPALATDVRLTIESAKTIEVTLDNGESVVCTGNHPFLMRSGAYKRADELVAGDSLMPLYRKKENQRSGLKAYEKVWQPWFRFWELTHHMVSREFNKKPVCNGNVIHHINENHTDNTPGNLKEMSRQAHINLHGEIGTINRVDVAKKLAAASRKRWLNLENRKKQSEMMVAENRKRKSSGNVIHIGKKISESKIGYEDRDVAEYYNKYIGGDSLKNIAKAWNCSVPTVKKRFNRAGLKTKRQVALDLITAEKCAPNNHKVVSIRDYGHEDVYDLTVEGTHNFALSCGVFVHNSHARNALARVSQFGTKSEKDAVRAAVHSRYPGIGKEAAANADWEEPTSMIPLPGKKSVESRAQALMWPSGASPIAQSTFVD